MALSHNSERLIHPGWSWYKTQKYNMTGKEYYILEWKEHIRSVWFSIANISSRHGEQIVTSSCFCISVILPPQTCVKLKTSVGMLWHIPAKDTTHLKTRKKQFRISSWGKCILLKKMIDGEICQIRNNFLLRTCCQFWQIAQRGNFSDFAKLPVLLEKWQMRKIFRFGKITWCGHFADFEKLCPKEEIFRILKNCQFACFTKKMPYEGIFWNSKNFRIASFTNFFHFFFSTNEDNLTGIWTIMKKAMHMLNGQRQVPIQEAVHMLDNQELVICSDMITYVSLAQGQALQSETERSK